MQNKNIIIIIIIIGSLINFIYISDVNRFKKNQLINHTFFWNESRLIQPNIKVRFYIYIYNYQRKDIPKACYSNL